MTKTVWYISKYLAPPEEDSPGGRGYLLLKEMLPFGVRSVVFSSDSNNLIDAPMLKRSVVYENYDGVEWVWLKTIKYSTAKSFRRIISWFHFEWNFLMLDKASFPRPDVVVVSSLSVLSILNGFIVRRNFGCKLVFEIRDIWPLTLVEEGGVSRYNPFVFFLGLIEYFGYKYSDLIVGTMPNLQEHVDNVLGYRKLVSCLPMGVDLSSINISSDLLSEDYFSRYLPSNKFIVAYAGTIGITNALESFFSCVSAMEHNSSVHFVILGDGSLRNHYMEKYGALSNLTFAPKIKKNQVHSFLSRCDLLYFSVFPSEVWRYGQSLNKVIDYMLSGKPILATYSGYPSMINEAQCGYFISSSGSEELVEKINMIYRMDADSRKEMGERGRKWLIERRSYPALAKQYLAMLFGGS